MYVSGGGKYAPANLQAWRNKLKRERAKRKADFAELIAEGYSASAASRSLGFSQQLGSMFMREIQQEMGE